MWFEVEQIAPEFEVEYIVPEDSQIDPNHKVED